MLCELTCLSIFVLLNSNQCFKNKISVGMKKLITGIFILMLTTDFSNLFRHYLKKLFSLISFMKCLCKLQIFISNLGEKLCFGRFEFSSIIKCNMIMQKR